MSNKTFMKELTLNNKLNFKIYSKKTTESETL